MRIHAVELTVTDAHAAATFFADVLRLPVHTDGTTATVTVGRSTLRLESAPPTAGAHHLAFDIAPDSFDRHRHWLSQQAPLLEDAEGQIEFEGPPAWNSRSVYFAGPDQMVLELIARRERPRATQAVPELLAISEVGIAVPSVPAAVSQVESALHAAVLGSASAEFAPVGDHDGLLILVRPGRGWLPVFDVEAQPRPVTVHVEGTAGAPALSLGSSAQVIID